ncbi:hypothetical protein DFA_09395 [Cavenderia fasciculata]|uniref:CUE domain-containing protein n=1 Tax=Cavenderia fasciculata TaxID=261658 RepID=F4Q7I2_CACFS|nr:uncharacterized protein DFA_09395 [Cavenderia fasciculata]EGG16364.1 hypothetical protein DFA_09395 [Cavenderia fasciculata]|eukprot:XP_004354748.1 hypothetical protein DFA_09395 [Cavenderia fasciculata]
MSTQQQKEKKTVTFNTQQQSNGGKKQQQQQSNGKNNNNNNNNNGNNRNNNNNNNKRNGGGNNKKKEPVDETVKAVSEIKEVLPKIEEIDIRKALEANDNDKQKALDTLIEDKPTSWSDVIKKKVKVVEETRFVATTQKQQQQTGGNNNSHQQLQPPQQQPFHFTQTIQQFTYEQSQHQSPDHFIIMQNHQQQQQQLHPEQIVGTISRSIDQQLRDIESKTKILLSLKQELDEINDANRTQLIAYQQEQVNLKHEEAQLVQDLNRVRQRLAFIDDEINRNEMEKLKRLKSFEAKSQSNGLLALTHY